MFQKSTEKNWLAKGEIEAEEKKNNAKVLSDEEIEVPSPKIEKNAKPMIRSVIKPSRPSTPNIILQDSHPTKNIKANGKVTRRLRSLVKDHRDLPM